MPKATKERAAAKPDSTKQPPFDTRELRAGIAAYLDAVLTEPPLVGRKRGNFRWGVYAFFDYDGEPIYVGQTAEGLRTRIRRHLTNQRTDAVAMNVLDPFEVLRVEVWPLPQYDHIAKVQHPEYAEAKEFLDALEHHVAEALVAKSKSGAILNEKDPPAPRRPLLPSEIPVSHPGDIVSEEVRDLRSHPDVRIARRAMVMSRLAQTISERHVGMGLRRVLLTQAKRLEWLAKRRFVALGGEAAVEVGREDDDN
jgi:hypothetical protein